MDVLSLRSAVLPQYFIFFDFPSSVLFFSYPERNDEGSYKRVCEGSSECRCDFTHCGLPFSGSFQIRVRAEAGLLRSEWAAVNFTPDLDGECV